MKNNLFNERNDGSSYFFKSSKNSKGKTISEVNNLTSFSVKADLLNEIVEVVLKTECSFVRKVSVALVGEEKIKELSRIYRNKDYVTDVLSFLHNEKNFLGEVILCPKKIKENAKKEDFTRELCRVMIHGVLHLLGYHHQTEEGEEIVNEKTEHYLKIFHKKI